MAKKFETIAIHGGNVVDETMSRATPIHRTTSFVFRDSEHAANLFGLKELGNIYTRLMNPTHDVLEKRLAELEGGVGALVVSSGMAAIQYSVMNVCQAGDEIVSAQNIYGGTYTLFDNVLPQFGITTRFVNILDLAAVESAINPQTRAIFTEVIGNPVLDVANIKALAALAQKHKLPLMVDSTFTTPYLLRPIEHGADVVIHSLTKWIGGHGTAIGGIIVDAGKFDWTEPKFRTFNAPDDSYGNLRFGHDLGPLSPLAFVLRIRLVLLRSMGACLSPDNAWFALQGLETLALRMERHCANAQQVAEFLQKHPKVKWVRYPGLPDDPSHAAAKAQLQGGFGSVIVFGVAGGSTGGKNLVEGLKMFSHLANVGDAKSLAIHPSTTTHSQLSEAQQQEVGITPDMVRLSIGIEHIDDILADLEQSLAQC